MTHYLALSIGPVQRTIQRARKTRELWAASFLLSQFMKQLLLGVNKYGEALSPDLTDLTDPKNDGKHHGAGVWNDNCFFKIKDGKLDELKEALPGIIQKAKSEILDLALFDHELEKNENKLRFTEPELRAILSKHFHCHAVLLSREEGQENPPILQALGELTAATKMRELYPPEHDDFVNAAMFRGKAVRALYHLGFDDNDRVFTFYKNKFDNFKEERRLPSLLEIGLREFRDKKNEDSKGQTKTIYQKIEDIISQKIKDNDDLETDEENQAIIQLLKGKSAQGEFIYKDQNGKPLFQKRHKYVAVVQSDGDGVGTLISSAPEVDIATISKELMRFSIGAVEEIFKFDALPVYAGGDDLMFISPLQNNEGHTVFDLIQNIQNVFAQQSFLIEKKASLSFGVSIFYYKYPLGEAVEMGRDLLNKLAKKLAFRQKDDATNLLKKGLAFRFMLHSGQSFASVLRQEGAAWDAWKNLLEESKNTAGKDIAFVSGVVHNLERLSWLLDEACKGGRAEHFFEQHFNEARGEQKEFIKKVRDLAIAIYNDYHDFDIAEKDQDKFFKLQLDLKPGDPLPDAGELRRMYCNNLLYSALRTIKFLNDSDHD